MKTENPKAVLVTLLLNWKKNNTFFTILLLDK